MTAEDSLGDRMKRYEAASTERVCYYCRCAECRCDDPADEDVSDREENIQRAAWRDMGGVSL